MVAWSGRFSNGVSFAAASDLPPTCARFSLSMCLKIMLMERCFVMRSALLPSPGILVKGTIFLAHRSWSHRQFTSMCLTLAIPWRSRVPLAAVASSSRVMPKSEPMSLQCVLMPRPSHAPQTTP